MNRDNKQPDMYFISITGSKMSSHISTSHFVSAFAARSSILRMRHSHQQRLEWTSKLFRKRGAEIAESVQPGGQYLNTPMKIQF